MKPSRLFFGTLFYDPNGSFVEVAPTITLSGTVSAASAAITGAVEREVNLSGTIQSLAAGVTGTVTITSSGPITLGRVVITVT